MKHRPPIFILSCLLGVLLSTSPLLQATAEWDFDFDTSQEVTKPAAPVTQLSEPAEEDDDWGFTFEEADLATDKELSPTEHTVDQWDGKDTPHEEHEESEQEWESFDWEDPAEAEEESPPDQEDAFLSEEESWQEEAWEDTADYQDPWYNESFDETHDDEYYDDETYPTDEPAVIEFPGLGTIVFEPFIKDAEKFSAVAQQQILSQTQKTIDLGLLKLQEIEAKIEETGELALRATTNFLGEKTEVTLVEITAEGPLLKIGLKKPLVIPFGKQSMTCGLFFLQCGEEPYLFSEQNLFASADDLGEEPAPDTVLTIGLTPEQSTTLSITQAPIEQLFPGTDKLPADIKATVLRDIEVTIPNPLITAVGAAPVELSALATADLSHITLYDSIQLTATNHCTITLGIGSVAFSAVSEEPLIIAPGVTFKEPSLELSLDGLMVDFKFTGKMTFDVPILGTLTQSFLAKKEGPDLVFSSQLDRDIDFKGVRLKAPKIFFSRRGVTHEDRMSERIGKMKNKARRTGAAYKLYIQADANILDREVLVTLNVVKSGRHKKLSFKALLKGVDTLKPFHNVPGLKSLDVVKDVSIEKPHIGISSDGTFFFGGATTIANTELDVSLRFKGPRPLLKGRTKNGWKLSDTVPGVPPMLDMLQFKDISFMVAGYSYFDHDLQLKIKKGFSIVARIDTTAGIFEQPKKILGPAMPSDVAVSITIGPSPNLTFIKFILPIEVGFGPVSMHNLALEVSGTPSISMLAAIKVVPSEKEKENPLIFTSRIEFAAQEFGGAGTMEGMWYEPFGLTGFDIGNLAAELACSYSIPPVPTSFGVTGQMRIGDHKMRVALKYGSEQILLGELSRFYLQDIVKLAQKMNIAVGDLSLIDLKFKDMKFYYAPMGGSIGELIFDPGVNIAATMELAIPGTINTDARIDITVDPTTGIKGIGYLKKIDLGPLVITGKGEDEQYGTDDDAAIFKLDLTPAEQRLFVSAYVELLANKAQAEIDIRPTSLKIKTLLKLLNVFDFNVEAESYNKGEELGIRLFGDVELGTEKMQMIGNLSNKQALLAGKMEKMTLQNMVEVANQLGADIPTSGLPALGAEELEFVIKAGNTKSTLGTPSRTNQTETAPKASTESLTPTPLPESVA